MEIATTVDAIETNVMDYIAAATFLLECPPLNEMDEFIANIAEKYRFNMINKEAAINEIINNHSSFLKRYITNNNELNNLLDLCRI